MSLLLIGLAGELQSCVTVDQYLRFSGCYMPLWCSDWSLVAARDAAMKLAEMQGCRRHFVGVVLVRNESQAQWVREHQGQVVFVQPMLSLVKADNVQVMSGDVVLKGNADQLTRKIDDVLLDCIERVLGVGEASNGKH